MQKVTKIYEVYSFDELDEQGKSLAIGAHIAFEIEIHSGADSVPNWMEQAIKEMEKMQTPWFLSQYIYEQHKEEIISTIKANNYMFFSDGRLIPTDLYPEKTEISVTKKTIYDEMCRILTDFDQQDDMEEKVDILDLHDILVKIQNNWENVITAQDE